MWKVQDTSIVKYIMCGRKIAVLNLSEAQNICNLIGLYTMLIQYPDIYDVGEEISGKGGLGLFYHLTFFHILNFIMILYTSTTLKTHERNGVVNIRLNFDIQNMTNTDTVDTD